MAAFVYDQERGFMVPRERRIEPIRSKRLCSLMAASGPAFFGASVGGDPFRANVSLLLQSGSWTENGTTIADLSSYATTQTAGGNTKTTLLDSDFPDGCIVFDGTNSYLSCPHLAQRDMHSGTTIGNTTGWSFEFDFKPGSTGADQVIANKGLPASGGDGDPGWRVMILNGGYIRLDVGTSGTNFGFWRTSTTLSATVKKHIAVEVTLGVPSIAFDGVVQAGSYTGGSLAFFQASDGRNPAYPLDLGSLQTDSGNPTRALWLNGKLNRVRETYGVSRYGGVNFTPPVGLLPTS